MAGSSQEATRSRRNRTRRSLVACAVLAALVVVWAVGIEPRFVLDEEREVAEIPHLPDGWRGAEIGVISDLQVGMWLDNLGMVERAVDALIEQRPAAVLVLGDFVYGTANTQDNVETAVELIRPLTDAGIPTLAVLGNHDHTAGAAEVLRQRLPAIGVQLLHNEATTLERDGDTLHVAGIGSAWAGVARPDEAVDGIPPEAARVVMMHNPTSFEGLPADTAPLAVAGHTHGGQLRLPFLPEWSYLSLVEDNPVHVDGWIDDYGAPGNELYVNRGIGMSRIPARLNCSPAITLFELRPPADQPSA